MIIDINIAVKKTLGEFKSRKTFFYFLAFLLIVSFQQSVAQVKRITGIVVDNTGEGIVGVNVKVKNTKTATTTTVGGKYSINADSKSILQFSFVGFLSQEVTVGGKLSVNVTLEEDAVSLNEVIIQTGYGTTKKMDMAGSVSTVSVKDLQKAPVTSFEEALAGRVAGVQVIAGDGQPGEALDIVIRGNNSINNSNSPLYVIDGFPIEDPNNNAINPAEIETIDVLKDASATSIYGSRGANGVIVITTKRGKVGDAVLSYNGYYGVNKIIRTVDLLNPYEFVKLQTEVDPTRAASSYFKDGKTLESYRGTEGADFQTKVFEPAPFQNHYISLTGGSKDTRYSVSTSVTNQNGVIINSGFKRYQGRATLDQSVGKKLKIGTNINYAGSQTFGQKPRDQNNNGTGNNVEFNLMYQIWAYRPISGASFDLNDIYNDFYDEDALDPGSLTRTLVNPTTSFTNEYRASFDNTFTGNIYAEYQFTNALKFRVTGGANIANGRNENLYNSLTRQGSGDNGVTGGVSFSDRKDYSIDNVLTYDKQFSKNHRLTLTGVYSYQSNKAQNYGFNTTHIQNDYLGIAAIGAVLNSYSSTNSSNSTYRLQSFATRASYQMFGGRYIFGATIRADGSSKFAPNNRYGFFPAGSAAWRFTEEAFMKKQKVVSSGKLRASYGVVGNNRVNDFAYVSTITQSSSVGPQYYTFGGLVSDANLAYFINVLGNEKVKWESTKQLDLGLELGFLKDKFLLEIDYYKKNTYDLLLNSALSPSVGSPANIIDNIGETSNQGIEFTLNITNIRNKNFTWTTNFNTSFNKNRIEALSNGSDFLVRAVSGSGNAMNGVNGYISQIGKSITAMYGYIYDGNYQIEDFNIQPSGAYVLKPNIPVNTNGGQTITTVQPGDPKYRDTNGDGLIDENDQTVIGNPFPIHIGGMNNNFTYKQFDLNIFMQWSYGNETYNANRLYLEGGTSVGFNTNQFATYANRWTPENRSNTIYRANAVGTRVYSTRFIEDASFIRLKTVQLGYTLPINFARKIKLRSARIYSSAQNLLTLTNYSSTDPENSTKGNGLTAGYDFSAYPRALTITFGLNVSL